MRDAQGFALRVDHRHCVARLRPAAIENVAGENPRMAGSDAAGAFAMDADGGQLSHHSLKAFDAIFGGRVC